MNPLSAIATVLGFLLLLTGTVGNLTDSLDALEVHSCSSEGILLIVFAMVYHLVKEKS
jgi:hypothetical protein